MPNKFSCIFCKHCQLNNFIEDKERKIEDGHELLKCKRFWCDYHKSYHLDVPIEPCLKGQPVKSAQVILSQQGCSNFEEKEPAK